MLHLLMKNICMHLYPQKFVLEMHMCGGILELRRGSQPSPWVGPGKPNLPLGLRGKAGGCARVTAGPKRPHPGSIQGEMEKEMVTHSSILAWKTPWKEEPGSRDSRARTRSPSHPSPGPQGALVMGSHGCCFYTICQNKV